MRNIQWETNPAERPFREQIQAMGWPWIEGVTDVPWFTERASYRGVQPAGGLTDT